jgi:aspartate carbamoyltransferase catalytic subunit
MPDHILSVDQFDRHFIESIFRSADVCAELEEPICKRGKKKMTALFYEPSSRTRFSFESAALSLGIEMMSSEAAGQFSSAAKGETLEDTIRVIHSYADLIVLRHPEVGAAVRAASVSHVPIINAGDGVGEHPTQALLDLYTIKKELGRVDDLIVTLVGDLKNGRTVHSLLKLLMLHAPYMVRLVSPPELRAPFELVERMTRMGIAVTESADMVEALGRADVVYMTRIQKERMSTPTAYETLKGSYCFLPEHLEMISDNGIVMHPLPRVGEIDPRCDDSLKAAYFRQAANGVPIRMALLKHLLRL